MRLSRHAKNKLRRLGLDRDELLKVLWAADLCGEDSEGNPLYVGKVGGIQLCIVVALDDGTTVITVYDRRT